MLYSTYTAARLNFQYRKLAQASCVSIYSCGIIKNNDQCTYLNSGLLVAPHEYVLHGLALSMY
jgi:hypothetical protein